MSAIGPLHFLFLFGGFATQNVQLQKATGQLELKDRLGSLELYVSVVGFQNWVL